MSEAVVNYYDCDVCGFRYKPSAYGGVDFDAQSVDFECPECQSAKDHFHLFKPPTDDVAPAPAGEQDSTDDVDPSGARVMYTSESSPTLVSLQLQFNKKRLDTQPDFQRYEVWSQQKKSALIESLLLDLPVPQVFLAQESDNTSVVIDGQQRLMAIFRYMADEFSLKGVVSAIEGKRFSQLPAELQEKIENYELRVVKILKESDPEIRFLLFQRLNEGSVSLNDQELRNCVRRGPYNEFLKEVADDAGWRKLLNLKKRHPRMVDVELALRFFAFRDQQYMLHPDKKTGRFLDKQMTMGSAYSDRDYVSAQADFMKAIELAGVVFGPRACRRFVAGSEEHPNGRWDSKINRALMDVQLWGFSRYEKGVFIRNAYAIREAAITLMVSAEFADLVTHTISEFKRLERRFDLWKHMIDSVVANEDAGSDTFSMEAKADLFKANPVCYLCKMSIVVIDDAQVRRIGAPGGGSADGGRVLLSHRYCAR